MLWLLVVVLLVFWLFGGGVSYAHGPALGSNGLIHLVLLVIVVVVVLQLLRSRGGPRDL